MGGGWQAVLVWRLPGSGERMKDENLQRLLRATSKTMAQTEVSLYPRSCHHPTDLAMSTGTHDTRRQWHLGQKSIKVILNTQDHAPRHLQLLPGGP